MLATPGVDIADFTDCLSEAWGVATAASAAQYIKWSEESGILAALAGGPPITAESLCRVTTLSPNGVDSLIPILRALGLARGGDGGYTLTRLGEEYFLPDSPYYVGPGLFWACEESIPEAYLKATHYNGKPPFQPPPAALWLKVQLSRNLAPGVCAVRSGRFRNVRHLVDIGGGAGSIAIPFALDNPTARVTLVDLPSKIDHIRTVVSAYHVEAQFTFRAADVFVEPWSFPECDGIVFGNFFHLFDDKSCRHLAERSAGHMGEGGRIWLHEMLFNQDKSGPMITSLWNANMRVIGGCQRTAAELAAFLDDAGFSDVHTTPTAGRFSLIDAVRPSRPLTTQAKR